MNQDQVKNLLLKLEPDIEEFSVIFSGKMSKKVDGLYHPEKREIIIHNRNFDDENTLIYTAIHEFAHHVHFTKYTEQVTTRSHTNLYWTIFHDLMRRSEEMGLYRNIFETDPDFKSMIREIREKFMVKNGELMKDFGKHLIQGFELCQRKHAIFEDFLDRILGMNRNVAKSMMKIYALDLKPDIGFENMRIVAGIKDPDLREKALTGFDEGKTPQMIRQEVKNAQEERIPTVKMLEAQKKRIEKNIQSLRERLVQIEEKISTIADNEEP